MTTLIENNEMEQNPSPKFQCRLCTLSLNPNNANRLVYKWPNKKYSDVDGFQIDNDIYQKITSRIWNSMNGGRLHRDGKLQCFSECVLANGHIVRAHPHFNSERPWYDWVMVKWDEYTETLTAKVLLMFKIESGQIENYNLLGDSILVGHVDQFLEVDKAYAIVQTVTGDIFNYRGRRFHLKSNLAMCYTLEKDLRLIEIESFDALTFVIMDNIGAVDDVPAGNGCKMIVMFKTGPAEGYFFCSRNSTILYRK
jgi:hypothetical protein